MAIPSSPLAADWEGKIIDHVAFDRTEAISEDDFFQTVRIQPGDRFRIGKIREGIKRLYRKGIFKDVSVEAEPVGDNRVALRFVLVEKRFLASIDISGNHTISEKEILNTLSLKPGDELTDARWRELLSDIASLYQREGFFLVKFSSQLRPVPDDRKK
ncbi:MAG: POTRA domain-containing protein [Nitrospiria bacterium]